MSFYFYTHIVGCGYVCMMSGYVCMISGYVHYDGEWVRIRSTGEMRCYMFAQLCL